MIVRISVTLLFCVSVAGCADSTEEGTSNAASADATTKQETASNSIAANEGSTVAATDETTESEGEAMSGPLAFEMETLSGEKIALSKYKGNAVLVVNVASACGLTPQYEQLQALHAKYAEQGLAVVGFPCNQFGGQEPGSADEIQEFCSSRYGVEFDMMGKVEVNGDGACDLYKYLTALETEPQAAGDIGWNFEKFLIDRNGKVINRFSPRTSPDDETIISAIETALAAKPNAQEAR